MELLRAADVVVHDRLVGPALLMYARPTARIIAVGKHGHGRSTPQEEINELLVREAKAGHCVVRLKGGDPFVFGRGAEECVALRNAGVPFEVVPGVTSVVAVPAAAGIPLTHRAIASGFAVVTGHLCGDADDLEGDEATHRLDWNALARMPTLVVLMGLRALPVIVARLSANGQSMDTPAAVISRGTLPDQQAVFGTLASIVADVAAANIQQPATLVVGDVVNLPIGN
jgi:uroporphyrin-III C-methyltransferase